MANHFFHLQIEGNSKRSSAQLNEQGDGPSLSSRRPAVEVSGIFPSFTHRFFYRADIGDSCNSSLHNDASNTPSIAPAR